MASWVRTITSPFRKARTFFNHTNTTTNHHPHKKSQQEEQEERIMALQGEVMACGYEDVQVMWSILDKSKPRNCSLTAS